MIGPSEGSVDDGCKKKGQRVPVSATCRLHLNATDPNLEWTERTIDTSRPSQEIGTDKGTNRSPLLLTRPDCPTSANLSYCVFPVPLIGTPTHSLLVRVVPSGHFLGTLTSRHGRCHSELPTTPYNHRHHSKTHPPLYVRPLRLKDKDENLSSVSGVYY